MSAFPSSRPTVAASCNATDFKLSNTERYHVTGVRNGLSSLCSGRMCREEPPLCSSDVRSFHRLKSRAADKLVQNFQITQRKTYKYERKNKITHQQAQEPKIPLRLSRPPSCIGVHAERSANPVCARRHVSEYQNLRRLSPSTIPKWGYYAIT